MDDGDGVKVSSSNEVGTGSAVSSADQEDVDSSKTPFTLDSGFTNSTPSHSLKMLLNYNSVNGDCTEKDVIQSEHSLVASSSNNSLFSEDTRDSLRRESESSSDYSSKSSESEISEVKLKYSFSKSRDNSSSLHRSPSFGSDSSSESDDMSESEDEEEDDNSKDRDERVETPDERIESLDERVETPYEHVDAPNERVETPDSQSSQPFQVDTPKLSLLVLHGREKENESGDTSQSDDSFKKEEDSHPEEPDKKDMSLDISLSSEDSTVDSERTMGHSLTSSISQDISLPQDAINSSTLLTDKVDIMPCEDTTNTPIEEKEKERVVTFTDTSLLNENVEEEKFLQSSVPEETSNSSFGVGGSSEENNTNSSIGEIKETPSLPKEASEANLIRDDEINSMSKEGEVASYKSPTASGVKSEEPMEGIDDADSNDNNQQTDNISPISIKSNEDQSINLVQNPELGKDLTENKVNDMSIAESCNSSCIQLNDNNLTKTNRLSIDSKNNNDNELSKIATNFSIKYKGFKKIGCAFNPKSYKKYFLRWNPFNPARKKDPKTGKYKLLSVPDEQDCSSLQPEYAQYLGLQPIVKFKCSYCGMSTFQSMSALNAHKVDCKRNVMKPHFPTVDNNKAITIRRRVFMCSVCGSYKPRSEVFQHMLEVHKSYICLFDKCLHICQSPDALLHHFRSDHQVEPKYCQSLEDFQKEMTHNFYVFCISCQKVFTELDDPSNHICTIKLKPRTEVISNVNEPDRDVTTITRIPSSVHSEVNPSQSWDFAKVTASLKLNNDITMKPVKDVHSSDPCEFRNNNSQEIFNNIPSENSPTKIENFTSEIIPKPPTENLNIKVPSDIEIKPLIPGEIHNQENKFEPSNESTIEIFPIPPTQPQKPIKKTRTIVKKTIRKKKVISKKKKNIMNQFVENDLQPIPEDTIAPPVSPPIIAPPPIVHSPECLPPPHDQTSLVIGSQPSEPEPVQPEQTEGIRSNSPLYSMEEEKPSSPEHEDFQLTLPERNEISDMKRSIPQDIFKIKLQDSDNESDDSQKLSLVVDENTNNSEDFPEKKDEITSEKEENNEILSSEAIKADPNDIPLASEDIAAMALTLDDKIENVPIQAVVKECVRTSCMSCNYCRHAVKIAVNGKQLALHLLSEHRYTPVKNETNDDVIRKLKSSLDVLQTMHFNAETYDSSDRSIHIPYDKESNFDCFQCSYVSASHKDLYTHKRKFHTKSLLLCIMCKKNFFSYSELICHICTGTYCADPQIYSVDINFRCCFCRLDTIPSAFRLMVHLRKSHHTCDICLEICTDQQKLSTHMWKHKLNHLCYRCGIAYASKPDITKHLFWKHGTESVLCKKCLQKKWPHVYHFCIPPTSFICEECNTSFSKAVALKVHKRIHGNDYPYSCTQCEKKFVSKKLLSRHIDRHNAILQKKDLANKSLDESKEEIINVTDVDNKDVFHNENSDSNKEGDPKDKSHKKHKKEKDKKDKKVLDVYDLPPLNLSSESDSSDEDSPHKPPPKGLSVENSAVVSTPNKIDTLVSDNKAPDMPKLDGMLDGEEKSLESSNFLNLLKQDESGDELSERKPTASEPVSPLDSSVVNSLLPMGKDEIKNDPIDPMQNDHSFMNWDNFFKTNSLNSNLPFPLCAMKSDVAYSIIMGDHDYCQQQFKSEPIIKEEWPSTSNQHLSDDKLEEVTPLLPEKPHTPPLINNEGETISTPTKKKLKSPKKKVNKTPDDKNSSSSSDSSSDSDSSCSCATNCSCSSSSDSTTTSSSDSDSSTNDDKKDKRRKKKDKKLSVKPDEREIETHKEMPQPEPEEEVVPLPEPEDPPIRESELETDESTSDEEFYDRQPQIIANQLLAEKREKQINLTTPINNGNASPLPITPSPQQLAPTSPSTPIQPLLPQIQPIPNIQENIPPIEQAAAVETPKPKPRAKRKRRIATPRTPKVDKPLPEPSFPKYLQESKLSPFSHFQQTPVARHKLMTPGLGRSPSLPEASGSGSETDNKRLSKRRRVPNKFYGYSSGEEEDNKPSTPKWRKMETPPTHHTPLPTHHTPKLTSTITHPPPTPRIQLTVPKQAIRKPYQKQSSKQKIPTHRPASSDSTDSGSDIDDRIPRPPSPIDPPKTEKDVYCYCRCPYDEVSEMIACDDANCKIEWFHFECVGILVPPRGQWYCPDCRKARGLPT